MKKELRKNQIARIPSGIKGFDKLIEGGIEKDSINLVVGDSGSGKSIFSMQFLVEGLKRGEKCLFVTFEEKKKEVYEDMARFGWNLEKYEKEGKFFFLEYNPEKVKMMIEEGGGEIESLVLKQKISRLVIDSITSFSLLFEDELEKREAALTLFDLIKRWGITTILTLQENPIERKSGSSPIEFEADSIILLYFIKKGNKRERFIEIYKMRGTDHSTETHKMEITEKGIEILD